MDIDHWGRDSISADPRLRPLAPILHETDVIARPAHVDRNDIAVPGRVRDPRARNHAARRTGQRQLDRVTPREFTMRHTSVGLHDEQLAAETGVLQLCGQRIQTTCRKRLDIGIDDRGVGR